MTFPYIVKDEHCEEDDYITQDWKYYSSCTQPKSKKESKKFDEDKTRYSLLYWPFIRGMAKVLTYGAKLYGENSWKELPDANRRYLDAAIRHLMDSEQDLDNESDLDHLLHAGCNIMFLYYMRSRSK